MSFVRHLFIFFPLSLFSLPLFRLPALTCNVVSIVLNRYHIEVTAAFYASAQRGWAWGLEKSASFPWSRLHMLFPIEVALSYISLQLPRQSGIMSCLSISLGSQVPTSMLFVLFFFFPFEIRHFLIS